MKKTYLMIDELGGVTSTVEPTTATNSWLGDAQVIEVDDSGNCTQVVDVDSEGNFITMEIEEV